MLVLIGCSLLLLTLIFFARAVSFYLTAMRAVGTIVELVPNNEDDDLFAPVVEFSAGGAVFKFRHSTFHQNPPYRLGAPVAVLYSARNPRRAAIKSLWLFLLPACLALGTLVVFVAARLA